MASKTYCMRYTCKEVEGVVETTRTVNPEELFKILKQTGHDVDTLIINIIYSKKA